MYQAIVFLPLLGAILAGIIALAGAHARYPGGAARTDGRSIRSPPSARAIGGAARPRSTGAPDMRRSRPPPARAPPS